MHIEDENLKALHEGYCSNPHAFLGLHKLNRDHGRSIHLCNSNYYIVRALIPDANSCSFANFDNQSCRKIIKLEKHKNTNIFEGIIKLDQNFSKYKLKIDYNNGSSELIYDPYHFDLSISRKDINSFNEGTNYSTHRFLGAHIKNMNGISGVSFGVWAPSAKRVSVIGDFNFWDGRRHMMRKIKSSGIWEIFIPNIYEGNMYKFEILGSNNKIFHKTDPYGRYFEKPTNNASIVYDYENYKWLDSKWLKNRSKIDWRKNAITIYEMHLGSWKRNDHNGEGYLNYREISKELIPYLKKMNFTHVEFMPVSEYPFDGSWGYQVTGYFAPSQRFGSPDDFKYLIDQLHHNKIGVIIDWVPAHFPKDEFALANFDGGPLFEDHQQGNHPDWGTLIFDYSRQEVKAFLVSNALFWIEHYHIDGLRVDAVASMLYLDYSRKEGEWTPNKYGGKENLEAISFLKEVNNQVHNCFPGALMIAEESTAFEGVTHGLESNGLGFDFKWNMGWMHDILKYMTKDPLFRKYDHNQLTFGMLYQYKESFIQVFSHDEVVHGKSSMIMKMPGDSINNKAQQLRVLYSYMWLWPGKKTLFMGNEFGQIREWNYNNELEWYLLDDKYHLGIKFLIRDLNKLYTEYPFLAFGDTDGTFFQWISCSDADSGVVVFARRGNSSNELFMVFAHFTPVLRKGYRVGAPIRGVYNELINTNYKVYGGDCSAKNKNISTEEISWDQCNCSIVIDIPPTSVLVYKYVGDESKDQ